MPEPSSPPPGPGTYLCSHCNNMFTSVAPVDRTRAALCPTCAPWSEPTYNILGDLAAAAARAPRVYRELLQNRDGYLSEPTATVTP